MARLLLSLVLLLAFAASESASAQTSVRDSVRMQVKIYEHYFEVPTGTRCQIGVYAVWPNVLQDILGGPDRTYGYSDYGRVATQGLFVPPGGEFPQVNTVEAVIPDGFIGHNPRIGGSAGISPGIADTCAPLDALIASRASGAWHYNNGRPFRITDWYATYTLPNGTPIALFEWEPADALQIAFDASFESEQSREIDAAVPGSKVPVASYAWNFGDGASGSGAKPIHEFDEPGDYEVRLTVTDDDGETASRTETVTVDGVFLRTEVEFATNEVAEGDTLTVRGTVTNGGTETIFAVSAERRFFWNYRVDETLNISGSLTSAPRLTALLLPDGEDVVVRVSSLAPGESIEVTRDYVVESLGEYRASLQEPYSPIDTFVDWQRIAGVEGETPDIDNVSVRQPCASADPACTTTLVGLPEYIVAIVPGSGPRARTGLPPGGTISDVRFVRYEDTVRGREPVCESGCVDVILTARDEDGNPGAGLDIEVQSLASGAPLAEVRGGFMCERVPLGESGDCVMDNGILTVTTDDDGEARVWIAIQAAAPTEQERQLTIEAELVSSGQMSSDELVLPIDETVIYDNRSIEISETSATWGGIMHNTLAAGAVISVGEWCENGIKWVRDQGYTAADLSRYQKNVLQTYGGTQIVSWVCKGFSVLGAATPVGAVLVAIDGVVDPARKTIDIVQYSWFVQEMGIENGSDLVLLQGPNAPPLVYWPSGDVLSLVNEVTGFAAAGTLSGGGHEILIQEATGLFQPTGATTEDDFDPELYGGDLRMRYTSSAGTVEALLTNGYVPVVTSSFSIGAGYLVNNENAGTSIGQEGKGGLGGDPFGTTSELAQAGTVSAMVTSWDGEPGEFVVIGEGTPVPEVVQVAALARPSGGDATLSFTTPLRYDHAIGVEIERIVEGEVTVPAPPVLQPHMVADAPSVLWWSAMPRDLASSFDLQVASDTTASALELVIEESGIPTDSLVVASTLFRQGIDYSWRVRSTNEVGTGVWTPWQTFRPGTSVGSEASGSENVPLALALAPPYPNPTRGGATVGIELPESVHIRLAIYDALGREVLVANDAPFVAGRHTVTVPATDLPAGVYLLRLTAGSEVAVQRLTVVQ